MRLIEADGKRLLKEAGMAVPASWFVPWSGGGLPAEATFPLIVKSQVLQGGRGKLGWIKRAASPEELSRQLEELCRAVGDTPCAGFLCEAEAPHAEEWLVSLTIDSSRGRIMANVSRDGGMEVSQVVSRQVSSIGDIENLPHPQAIRLALSKLWEKFAAWDVLCVEINPLTICADGSAMALDAKIELDDAAAFRHPEWAGLTPLPARAASPREAEYAAFLDSLGHRGTLGRYVELDGDIAMVLSGGGASLTAMDALRRAGGRAANYVEMSGNPEADQVRQASRIVFSRPGIKAVWIAGSFANFTDIQVTVNAVLRGLAECGLRVPVVVRRDGPNAVAALEDAREWARNQGMILLFDRADVDLDASARRVVELAHAASCPPLPASHFQFPAS